MPAPRAARSTTILGVRRDGLVALGGDGQVTLGNVVAKADATKIRRVGQGGKVLVGFAGSAARRSNTTAAAIATSASDAYSVNGDANVTGCAGATSRRIGQMAVACNWRAGIAQPTSQECLSHHRQERLCHQNASDKADHTGLCVGH